MKMFSRRSTESAQSISVRNDKETRVRVPPAIAFTIRHFPLPMDRSKRKNVSIGNLLIDPTGTWA